MSYPVITVIGWMDGWVDGWSSPEHHGLFGSVEKLKHPSLVSYCCPEELFHANKNCMCSEHAV